MSKDWSKVTTTAVPQYPLRGYGALTVLYNAEEVGDLIVAGYASPQVVDREKHLITKEALAKDLPRFLAHPHYRNAMLLHSNVQVGEVLPKWCNPETGECWETKVDEIGLFAVVKVRTDAYRPSIVDKVIEDVYAGKIASFSISADAPFESRRYECVDGTCFWIIDNIEFYEITLCETPVNQDANFTILSKSLDDEFKLSAFCQDGSCPINLDVPEHNDRMAFVLRKAPKSSVPGFSGTGIADPVKPIPAAAPKPAKDPRKPQQADVGARAGGIAGERGKLVAKDIPALGSTQIEIGNTHPTILEEPSLEKGADYEQENMYDLPGDLEPDSYANFTDDANFDGGDNDDETDGQYSYDNKPVYKGNYAFSELESILERSIDELDLGTVEIPTRVALASIQKNRHTILKGFSAIRKGNVLSWVTWTDSLPSTLNKEFIDIYSLLDNISNKAIDAGKGEIYNDAQSVKSILSKRFPLRGQQAENAFNNLITNVIGLNKALDNAGLEINPESLRPYIEKGFQIGWIGNAQRLLHNAIESLKEHVINHAATRDSMSPDILAALDVLYEDMQALEDNLGFGMVIDKYSVQGDHPELEIITEVANSTVQDVKEADLLLEKVDEGINPDQDLDTMYAQEDPAQHVEPKNFQVQAEPTALQRTRVYVGDPTEIPAGARAQRGPKGGMFWDTEYPHIENPKGDNQEQDDHSDDGMIAWFMPEDLAAKIALADGEAPDALHMTLAYIPNISNVDPNQLMAALQQSIRSQPLKGEMSGVGRFSAPNKDVCYISVDAPGLPELRASVVQACETAGVEISNEHGFTPHITLKYLDENEPSPVHRLPNMPITIEKLTVVLGGKPVGEIPLGQQMQKSVQNKGKMQPVIGSLNDVWEAHRNSGHDYKALPHREVFDTVSQGVHNPVSVNRFLHSDTDEISTLDNNLDDPVHITPNSPVEQASLPGTDVHHAQRPTRADFDNRGAVVNPKTLKSGDEDARLTALQFARVFHRAMGDSRFKLALVKQEEDGQQHILDLGD